MSKEDDELSIGDVARLAGVPASTLRYWERRGLLEPPTRVAGRRRYTTDVLRRLSLIALAKRAGFTIAETRTLLVSSDPAPPSEIWRALATRKLPQVEQRISQANEMKGILERGLQCDCRCVEDCLDLLSLAP